jgi:hypothetical protein
MQNQAIANAIKTPDQNTIRTTRTVVDRLRLAISLDVSQLVSAWRKIAREEFLSRAESEG